MAPAPSPKRIETERSVKYGVLFVVLVCAALGHLGSPLAVSQLLECLNDQSIDIRRASLRALQRITGEDHGEDPEAWAAAGW